MNTKLSGTCEWCRFVALLPCNLIPRIIWMMMTMSFVAALWQSFNNKPVGIKCLCWHRKRVLFLTASGTCLPINKSCWVRWAPSLKLAFKRKMKLLEKCHKVSVKNENYLPIFGYSGELVGWLIRLTRDSKFRCNVCGMVADVKTFIGLSW